MENNTFNLNNKTYSNNNNLMIEIINELNIMKNDINDILIKKLLGDIINKMNYIINENKLNKRFDKLNINNINNINNKIEKNILWVNMLVKQ